MNSTTTQNSILPSCIRWREPHTKRLLLPCNILYNISEQHHRTVNLQRHHRPNRNLQPQPWANIILQRRRCAYLRFLWLGCIFSWVRAVIRSDRVIGGLDSTAALPARAGMCHGGVFGVVRVCRLPFGVSGAPAAALLLFSLRAGVTGVALLHLIIRREVGAVRRTQTSGGGGWQLNLLKEGERINWKASSTS